MDRLVTLRAQRSSEGFTEDDKFVTFSIFFGFCILNSILELGRISISLFDLELSFATHVLVNNAHCTVVGGGDKTYQEILSD